MFCWKCGNEIKEGQVFCDRCGARVEVAGKPGEAVSINAGNKTGNKKLLAIGIPIAAVVMICIVAVVVFLGHKGESGFDSFAGYKWGTDINKIIKDLEKAGYTEGMETSDNWYEVFDDEPGLNQLQASGFDIFGYPGNATFNFNDEDKLTDGWYSPYVRMFDDIEGDQAMFETINERLIAEYGSPVFESTTGFFEVPQTVFVDKKGNIIALECSNDIDYVSIKSDNYEEKVESIYENSGYLVGKPE